MRGQAAAAAALGQHWGPLGVCNKGRAYPWAHTRTSCRESDDDRLRLGVGLGARERRAAAGAETGAVPGPRPLGPVMVQVPS